MSFYTFEELKWDKVPILIFKVSLIYRFYTFEELKWDKVPILIFKVSLIYRFKMAPNVPF
jgi:hypothetical protein